MRNSKIFIACISIVTIILMMLDLPGKLDLRSVKVPFIEKNKLVANFVFDPSNINVNIGNIKIHKDLSFKLGLDLQGGTQLIYRVNMKDVKSSERKDAFESAINLIGQTAVLTFWEGGQGKSESPESDYFGYTLGQIVGGKAIKTNLTGKD